MSERDTDYSIGTQNSAAPQSSGADDSPPDTSKSTAEFRAFASQASDAEQPWNMKAPGRKIILLAVAVVVVAVVLAIVAIGVLNA
jgi:anti-sigma-K factor RskA